MANNFYPWIDDSNVQNNQNLYDATNFSNDDERESGFIPNTVARSKSTNSGMRQANLVAAALMTVAGGSTLSPSNPFPADLDLRSKLDDVATAIKKMGSYLSVDFTQAGSRTNLVANEDIRTSFGKISKFFADLKEFAFNAPQTAQGTSNYPPTTDLLTKSSFARVYRSIAEVDSQITTLSPLFRIVKSMTSNSVLFSDTSGYTDHSLNPESGYSGKLEVIKKESKAICRLTIDKSPDNPVTYFGILTVFSDTSGRFTGWKKLALADDIGNGTINIQKNGTTVESFTLNQSNDKNINIIVPTQLNQMSEDSTHRTVTDDEKTEWNEKSYIHNVKCQFTWVPGTQSSFVFLGTLIFINDVSTPYTTMTDIVSASMKTLFSDGYIYRLSPAAYCPILTIEKFSSKITIEYLASSSTTGSIDLDSTVSGYLLTDTVKKL